MSLEDLRISDFELLLQLPFVRSIRELARLKKLDPQNLTKRIAKIEATIGVKIVERNVLGISLTEGGRSVIERIKPCMETIQSLSKIKTTKKQRHLRLCARGFMVEYFISKCLKEFSEAFPETIFDFMDLSPTETERAARRGLIDIALSFEDILLGKNWQQKKLGEVSWNFYGRKKHPLNKKKIAKDFSGYPLIGFCHIQNDQLVSLKSPMQDLKNGAHGHRTENTRYTSQIIRQSDAIAYLPDISLESEIQSNEVTVINTQTPITHQRRPFCLHINSDSLKQKELKIIFNSMKPMTNHHKKDS